MSVWAFTNKEKHMAPQAILSDLHLHTYTHNTSGSLYSVTDTHNELALGMVGVHTFGNKSGLIAM